MDADSGGDDMTARKWLHMGEDLRFPLDLITARTTICGQTDTGKTSTAVVLVEEAKAAGAQVVIIDPSGAWWGITSSADGKRPGLDMIVMGGEHGDVPLNEHAGRAVARLVAGQGYSVVLDLDRPHFRGWGARQRFVADFLGELYEIVRTHILIVIDEAHRFAPQNARATEDEGHVARCLGAVVDVAALARRRGLSLVVITQRLAKLHKDVLELCEVLIAHRLRGNNDRKAAQGWLDDAGEDVRAIMAAIGRLEKGVAHVSAPTLGIEGVYPIRPKRTFDSSATVGLGSVAATPSTRSSIDLGAVRELLAETIEAVEADDPAHLRQQLADVRRQLAEARDSGHLVAADVDAALADRNMSRSELDDIAEVLGLDANASGSHHAILAAVRELLDRPASAGLPDSVLAEVRMAYQVADHQGDEARRALAELDDRLGHLGDVLQNRAGVEVYDGQPVTLALPAAPDRPTPTPREAQAAPQGAPDAPEVASNGLVAGARRMLTVLQRYGPLTRAELSTLAKSHGGASRNNLSALRAAGLVVEESGRVVATGFALGPFTPYTPEQVAEMYEGDLVAGARRILSVLMRAPDKGFTRSELEGLAQSRGGAFRNNLGSLRKKGLIEERNRRVYPGHALYAEQIVERRG